MNLPIAEHIRLAIEEYWIKFQSKTETAFDFVMYTLLEDSIKQFMDHWYDKEETQVKQ